MKIHFSRTNAPLMILDEDDNHVGHIHPTYRDVTRKCECCGQPVFVKNVITGYSLQIKGRYWGRGLNLRPPGVGGASGVNMPRLKHLKQLAKDRLES